MHKFPPFCLISFQPCCFLPLWTIHLFFPHPHLCPVPPPNSFFPNPLPPLFISFNFAFLSSWGRRYAFSLYLCPLISLSLSLNVFLLSLTLVVSFSLFLSLSTFVLAKHTPFFFLLKSSRKKIESFLLWEIPLFYNFIENIFVPTPAEIRHPSTLYRVFYCLTEMPNRILLKTEVVLVLARAYSSRYPFVTIKFLYK